MPYENISAELEPAVAQEILDKIKEIDELLPFLINLTPGERQTLPKMGDKSVAFVEKTQEYAKNNAKLVPPYLDMAEQEKDFKLAKALMPINAQLNSLAEKIDDTTLAVGSEAYTTSLGFYNSVKQATKMDVPGTDAIYNDLKERFKQASSGGGEG